MYAKDSEYDGRVAAADDFQFLSSHDRLAGGIIDIKYALRSNEVITKRIFILV